MLLLVTSLVAAAFSLVVATIPAESSRRWSWDQILASWRYVDNPNHDECKLKRSWPFSLIDKVFPRNLDVSEKLLTQNRLPPATINAIRSGNADQRKRALKDVLGLDLKGRDLRYANLASAKLLRADIRYADLKCADLSDADLTASKADQAHFERVDMSRAHLQDAVLHSAHLQDANLLYANLKNADFFNPEYSAHLKDVNMLYAHLEGANLFDANLEGADLTLTHLEGANLSAAHLENANLRNAWRQGAELFAAHLEGANLSEAHLEDASLIAAHLEDANLIRTNLEGTFFNDAHLEGTNLSKAHLEGAILQGKRVITPDCFENDSLKYCIYENTAEADLSEAHLEGANLSNAWLQGTNLTLAHLDGANLSHAHLEGAFLPGASIGGSTCISALLSLTDLRELKRKSWSAKDQTGLKARLQRLSHIAPKRAEILLKHMRKTIGKPACPEFSKSRLLCMGGIAMGAGERCPDTPREYNDLLVDKHVQLACRNRHVAENMAYRVMTFDRYAGQTEDYFYRHQLENNNAEYYSSLAKRLLHPPNHCLGAAALPNYLTAALSKFVESAD